MTLFIVGQSLEIIEPDPSDEHLEEKIVNSYRQSAEICLWLFTDGIKSQSLRKSAEAISDRTVPKTLFSSFTKPAEIEYQKG